MNARHSLLPGGSAQVTATPAHERRVGVHRFAENMPVLWVGQL